MKKLFGLLMLSCLLIFGSNTVAKAGEIKEVFIEGIEEMSQEEASEYIADYIGLSQPFNLDELTGINTISFDEDGILVTFTTRCNLGYAEKVGIKEVYLQRRPEGSNTYGNIPIWDYFCDYDTNTFSYAGGYEVKDAEEGLYYRGKQRHFIVYEGVEYSYYSYTGEIHYVFD